jgi:carbonic anhydrase
MQTIEEYKEYTKQLENEVKQWHDAFDASQVQVKKLTKENLRLERERVEQNSIIETCANELEELRLHEVEWDLAKARIKELEAENKKLKELKPIGD